MIPTSRQHILMTTNQISRSQEIMSLNFKIWLKFGKIFLKLNNYINPMGSDAEKLKREFQSYNY